MRKILLAAMAAASLTMLVPDAASARGFRGGGFHGGGGFRGGGGGFRGGYGGVGFRGGFGGYRGGFYRGAGIGALGVGLGLGYYGSRYGYGGGYGYPYAYSGYYDGGCYLVQRRVWTPYGWRLRPVQVCG